MGSSPGRFAQPKALPGSFIRLVIFSFFKNKYKQQTTRSCRSRNLKKQEESQHSPIKKAPKKTTPPSRMCFDVSRDYKAKDPFFAS